MVSCLTPIHAVGDPFFVSLNDTLLLLNDETMPIWWQGDLYAPASILDSRETGISVGTNVTYNEYTQELIIRAPSQMLVFELDQYSCYNYHTGEEYDVRAINLNGRVYVPIYVVCNFFDLSVNLHNTEYGRLLRITNSNHVFSGEQFIEYADYMLAVRLKEYNKVEPPAPVTPDIPTPEEPEEPEEEADIPLYYGVRCDGGDATDDIYATLKTQNKKAVFFLSPEQIAADGNLVRMLLSNGHSIGILAEGNNAVETQDILENGLTQLARVAYTTTTIALVPPEQNSEISEEGWVLWNETASIIADEGEDAARYATAIIRALQRDESGVYITLNNSQEVADVFAAATHQLQGRMFIASVPLETKL